MTGETAGTYLGIPAGRLRIYLHDVMMRNSPIKLWTSLPDWYWWLVDWLERKINQQSSTSANMFDPHVWPVQNREHDASSDYVNQVGLLVKLLNLSSDVSQLVFHWETIVSKLLLMGYPLSRDAQLIVDFDIQALVSWQLLLQREKHIHIVLRRMICWAPGCATFIIRKGSTNSRYIPVSQPSKIRCVGVFKILKLYKLK